MRKTIGTNSQMVLFALLGFVFISLGPALGQDSAPGNPPSVSAPPEAAASSSQLPPPTPRQAADTQTSGQDFTFMRMLGGLIVVVSLIIATFYGGRKFFPQYFSKPAGDKRLKLLESLGMGDKRNVALLQVDNKIFLVGNTSSQITFLANISDSMPLVSAPEFASVLQPSAQSPRSAGDSFRNLYEVEKKQVERSTAKAIPPDIRAKMRQLREALEH